MRDSSNNNNTWSDAYKDYSRQRDIMVNRLELYGYDGKGEGETSPPSPRETLLNEAKRIVTGERNKSYGEPEDNSRRIGDLWNVFLQGRTKPPTEPLDPYEVFLMMGLMKIARLMHDPSNYDSYLDAVGYITVAWDAYSAAKGDSSP